MSPETALLSEIWQIVKIHINVKERVEVAEAILRTFDEHIDIDDINLYANEFDRTMKAAIISHFDDDDFDEDDDEDEYDDGWD